MIESFLPQAPSQTAGPGSSAPLVPSGPPDVSLLPPAEAARTLGNWNYDQQDWAHASEHYEQSIALGMDNPDVRTDLGNCFRFLGQPQKALAEYQAAQKQNPQHENSLFNQISLYNDLLHDHAKAVTAAQEFIARFPQSPQAATARQLSEKPAPGDAGGVKR
jgi:tetratricopeptide (TPR) repeat protein